MHASPRANRPYVHFLSGCSSNPDTAGHIELLNERWRVGSKWISEYVRATINTAKQTLTILHKASDQANWRVIKNRSFRIKESVHALLPQFKRNRARCRDYLPS
jgi:hypothetical protein